MNYRILICILLLAGLICLPCTGATSLSGRVYDGLTGDESVPAPGITISCYCSQQVQDSSKMISWGTQIGQSVTDSTGYWEIAVLQACPYYLLIRSSVAVPRSNEGASSVGGTVKNPAIIEYAGPLAGKTLTGNKFWYRTERFSGRVYEGAPGDESTPVAGIDISCMCAGAPVDPDPALPLPSGSVTGQAQTDPAGYWEITPVNGCSPYYLLLLELPPAFPLSPNGAASVGGDAVRRTVIQYGNPSGIEPLQGKVLTGNKFWLTALPAPGSTPASPPASPPPAPAPLVPGTQQPVPSVPGAQPGTSPVIRVDTPPDGEPGPQGGVRPENVRITGQVFREVPGTGEEPLMGVPVEIFCSDVAGSPGIPSGVTETDTGGNYLFEMPGGGCKYYMLVAHPAEEVIRASSPSGVVVDGNRIVIPAPLPGSPAEANNFVLAASMPGLSGTQPGIIGIGLLSGGVLVAGVAVLLIVIGIIWKKRKKSDE